MQSYRMIRFLTAVIFSAAIMAVLGSCTPDTGNVPDTTPTSVLFDPAATDTAIPSGNMLYGSFLASDGKYIFFQSKEGKSLVRSNFDGSELMTLTARTPSFINCVNSQLFFIAGTDSGPIYKIDIDGKGETMISDEIARSIIASESDLYYISALDDQVYRMLHDGSRKTLIFPAKASGIMFSETTLYIQPVAPDRKIYRIPLAQLAAAAPDHPIVLKDIQSESISFYPSSVNVENDVLWFSDELFTRTFFLNVKGQTKSLNNDKVNQPFIISSGFLYFVKTSDNNRLYRFDLDNSDNAQMVVNDVVDKFVIIGNSIYYKRTTGSDVYRTSIGGGQSQKIT
ncbi:MAG: DUF5050 domain-containing protein [Saccharofermentanales bacterium]